VSQLKQALVTGASGRVGAAVAARLRDEGWAVIEARGRADGDVSVPLQARTLVERAVSELGGLDLLVHAAGEGFAPASFEDVTEDAYDRAFGATAKGTFFLAQAAATHLRAARGTIVNIEDVAAFQPWPSFAPHCAAKAAQAMLTRVLAKALAPDVRVVGVAPGPVAVDPGTEERRARETVLGRVGSADDIAGAVVFLAGATFVTGTTLIVDGGRLLQSAPAARP